MTEIVLMSNISDMEDPTKNFTITEVLCANLTILTECGYNEECGICSKLFFVRSSVFV